MSVKVLIKKWWFATFTNIARAWQTAHFWRLYGEIDIYRMYGESVFIIYVEKSFFYCLLAVDKNNTNYTQCKLFLNLEQKRNPAYRPFENSKTNVLYNAKGRGFFLLFSRKLGIGGGALLLISPSPVCMYILKRVVRVVMKGNRFFFYFLRFSGQERRTKSRFGRTRSSWIMYEGRRTTLPPPLPRGDGYGGGPVYVRSTCLLKKKNFKREKNRNSTKGSKKKPVSSRYFGCFALTTCHLRSLTWLERVRMHSRTGPAKWPTNALT